MTTHTPTTCVADISHTRDTDTNPTIKIWFATGGAISFRDTNGYITQTTHHPDEPHTDWNTYKVRPTKIDDGEDIETLETVAETFLDKIDQYEYIEEMTNEFRSDVITVLAPQYIDGTSNVYRVDKTLDEDFRDKYPSGFLSQILDNQKNVKDYYRFPIDTTFYQSTGNEIMRIREYNYDDNDDVMMNYVLETEEGELTTMPYQGATHLHKLHKNNSLRLCNLGNNQ